MPNNYNLKDLQLDKTTALPASAASAQSSGIDLMNSANGDFVADLEVTVDAPALTTTELPDGKTMTYVIQHDTDVAFGTVADLVTIGTQTGAGGVGAAAATYRAHLPTNVKRYIRAKATLVAAAGSPTAKNFVLHVVN